MIETTGVKCGGKAHVERIRKPQILQTGSGRAVPGHILSVVPQKPVEKFSDGRCETKGSWCKHSEAYGDQCAVLPQIVAVMQKGIVPNYTGPVEMPVVEEKGPVATLVHPINTQNPRQEAIATEGATATITSGKKGSFVGLRSDFAGAALVRSSGIVKNPRQEVTAGADPSYGGAKVAAVVNITKAPAKKRSI